MKATPKFKPSRGRKKAARPKPAEKAEAAEQVGPGMPAKDSVVKVFHFKSPDGKDIEVKRTNETDPYDPPLEPQKEPGKGSS